MTSQAPELVETPLQIYLDKEFTRFPLPDYEPEYSLALSSNIPVDPQCPMSAVADVFSSLNVGTPLPDLAKVWHSLGNRSLSVGDVVVLGELAYRCDPIGWSVLDPSVIIDNCP